MPSRRCKTPPPKVFWKLREIEDAFRDEHPDWPEDKVRQQARKVHLGMHAEDERIRRSNRKHDKYEVPCGLNPGEPQIDD